MKCKPWIREGLNREVQTVNWALSASKIPVFQFTVCTSWFARPWFPPKLFCFETRFGLYMIDSAKTWCIANKGVVYKLHAGWFINRTPGGGYKLGSLFIKFKSLLCGNPTERGERKFNINFLAARQFISPTQAPWLSPASKGLQDRKQYNTSSIYTVNMSDSIFMRTRQKQKYATFVWNASKTRCTLVKRDRKLPAFP